MVRPGKRVVDIGTDHAYLPIYLIENKICPSVIACDIAEGPLGSAVHNIDAYQMTDYIAVRQSDGLQSVKETEAEDIVIAGMGGELIASILHAAPWTKNPSYHLILQPMSMADYLRKFLLSQGFSIEKEKAVTVGKHVYTVLSVYYSGEQKDCGLFYSVVGEIRKDKSEDGAAYLKKCAGRILKIANGLKQGGKPEEAKIYYELYHDITEGKDAAV